MSTKQQFAHRQSSGMDDCSIAVKGAILKTRQNMQGLVNVPFFLGMLNILNITKTRYLVEKIYPQCLGDVKN